MGYKINPPSNDELRQLAYQRLGMAAAQDVDALSAEQARKLLEELAINKMEVEIQNEYLQDTWARLELALTEARDLYDFAPIGCISTDPTGRITKLNLTAASMLGQERNLLMDCDFGSFFLPVQHAEIQVLMHQASNTGEDQRAELTIQHPKGPVQHVQTALAPLAWGQGYHVVLTDITSQKALENDLRANEERWKFALDATGDGVWDWHVASGTVDYSLKLPQLYGYTAEQFGNTMESWRGGIHPDDWGTLLSALQKCLNGKETRFTSEHRGRCKDGTWKWIRCQGAVFGRDADGKVTRLIGTHSDITLRKRMEEALLEMTGVQQAVFESLPHYLAVLDGEGNILQTNAAWNAYALANGHASRNGFARAGYAQLLDAVTGGVAETKQATLAGIAQVAAGKVPSFQLDYSCKLETGLRWFSLHAMPVRDGRARVLVCHQDVTRIKLSDNGVLHNSHIDELTGALTRRHFFQAAEQEFARARRYKQPLMALVVNLADFSGINARNGVAAGDAVLQSFVKTARQVLRDCDLMGRLGGDEFALLLPNTALEGGTEVAERLMDTVAAHAVDVADTPLAYAVRVGGSCLQDDASFTDLLQRASTALQESRNSGADGVLVDTAGAPCLW